MANDVFMALRNDKERMAFLDNYKDDCSDYWHLKNISVFDRRFFAYEGDNYTVYVEDELQTVHWPKTAQKWISKSYYLVEGKRDGRPFSDYRMSRSQIINWVKEHRKLSENSGG